MGTDVTTAEQIDESQATTAEAKVAVSQMISRLFEHWRLNDSDRAALLGHLEQQPTVNEAVASNESAERIGHLLAIHAHLRTLFPQNLDVAYGWMSAPNRALGDQTPVSVVREQGLDGLRAVRAYLEHAVGA